MRTCLALILFVVAARACAAEWPDIAGVPPDLEVPKRYLRELGAWELGAFTIQKSGFRNHNGGWVLRPCEAREKLRAWFEAMLR